MAQKVKVRRDYTIGSVEIWRSKALLRDFERKRVGFALAFISDTCEKKKVSIGFLYIRKRMGCRNFALMY
jgi:hypothetical protein